MDRQAVFRQLAKNTENRSSLWSEVINRYSCKNVAEVGVYKGEFAQFILDNCPAVEQYTMVDPWRNLADWNKPANKEDDVFEQFYQETLARTSDHAIKRTILRGKTTEVVDEIPDESIDFAYIDGDHTLKGIAIDLVNMWDKISPNGFLAGDDFCPSIWQHGAEYEPTLVFPFAIYFAEAKRVKIYALPFNQFVITKSETGFEFIDMSDKGYHRKTLKDQISLKPTYIDKLSWRIKKNIKSILNR